MRTFDDVAFNFECLGEKNYVTILNFVIIFRHKIYRLPNIRISSIVCRDMLISFMFNQSTWVSKIFPVTCGFSGNWWICKYTRKVVSVPRNGKLLESQESKIYFFNTNSIKNMIIRMGTWVVISQTRVSLMRYTVSECIRNSASK